jgi:hypothetical protein
MSNTAGFIREHVGKFGLLGTNNRVPDDIERPVLSPPIFELTKDNHFRFGYDGGEYNNRNSSSANYWVEYGRPSRTHQGFVAELRRAIAQAYETHGALSVSNSGNAISRVVIALAKEMGILLEQITVDIEGYAVPAHDKSVPHSRYVVTWEALAEFAEKFSLISGCADPWIALEAFHGQVSSKAHVYSNARLHLANHNFDGIKNDVIGPPTWAVVEYEQATAVDRWLLGERRVGIPRIMFWSPELIAAQLDSSIWRDRIRRASLVPPEIPPSEIRFTSFELCKSAFPSLGMARSAEGARKDQSLSNTMSQLRTHLRRLNPGCNTTHYLPLHRVLALLQIDYDFAFDFSTEIYGLVDE